MLWFENKSRYLTSTQKPWRSVIESVSIRDCGQGLCFELKRERVSAQLTATVIGIEALVAPLVPVTVTI